MTRLFNKVFNQREPAFAETTASNNLKSVGKSNSLFMSANNDQERRTVEAGRRRKPDEAPSGGRDRAETPQRQQGNRGSSGGGGRSGLPVPGGKMGCGGIVLVILIVVIYFAIQFFGGSSPEESTTILESSSINSSVNSQLSSVTPADTFTTNYPALTSPAPSVSNQTWLVMLYQDADDQVLEKDICFDLNEAEKAGSSDRVKVVVQVDRYNGAYSGDNNWTSTKRFLLSQDDNLGTLKSQQLTDLGELNMSSGQTLIDFATWAIKTYPSDKYGLILSDHGMGWPGGWTDPVPKGSVDSSIPMETRLGDMLYLNEMDDALSQIRIKTGMSKFEVIGLDACLMAQQEVFTALEPHARYAIASEETEPSVGWAYTDFLKTLIQNPDMNGAQLAKAIVEGYIEDDQTIQDSSAKGDFLSSGSPFGGLFGQSSGVSSEQMARELGQSSTLTAVDLGKTGELNSSLNQLVYLFQNANQKTLATARSYAQSYTSVFGQQVPSSYIDLGNFVQIVKQNTSSSDLTQASDRVIDAIKNAVIAEKHGPQKPGSTGISIYFPNSQLYQNSITGAQSYSAIADRFVTKSLWDDFLAFHYSGQEFRVTDTRAVVPDSGTVRAPAAGGITVSTLEASRTDVSPGQEVTLSADVNGENIGHIYLFIGFYDAGSNSVFVADQDYLESTQTRQVNGVYYPDWGKGEFTLKFNWEPVVFAINDGKKSVPALFNPLDYGRSFEEAIYTVDGIYNFAESGEKLQSRLYFINGVMRQAFVFTGENEASAPREVIPQTGDSFTVLEKWLDMNSNGQVTGSTFQEGETLTFGQQMFTWKTLDAAAGEYAVGFVVEDLDGNQKEALTRIMVK